MTDFEQSILEVNKQEKTPSGYIVYYPARNKFDESIGVSWTDFGFNTDDIEFEKGSGLFSKTSHWKVKKTVTKSSKFFSFYKNLEDIQIDGKIIDKNSLWFRDESIKTLKSNFVNLYLEPSIKKEYSNKEFSFYSNFDPNSSVFKKCYKCNGKGYIMLNHGLLGIENFENCSVCGQTGNISNKAVDYVTPNFLK